MTVDMDGVLATTFLGLPNVAIGRHLRADPLPSEVARIDEVPGARAAWRVWVQRLRYAGRRPLPGALEGVAALASRRTLALVTGRSWLAAPIAEAWLDRYGMRRYFAAVYANNTRLPSAQFKLWMARQLGAAEHIDDDGSTAYYLASHGMRQVFLRDWPLNRGLPYPPQVIVVHSVAEAARYLA
jgi:hypothetical protein